MNSPPQRDAREMDIGAHHVGCHCDPEVVRFDVGRDRQNEWAQFGAETHGAPVVKSLASEHPGNVASILVGFTRYQVGMQGGDALSYVVHELTIGGNQH